MVSLINWTLYLIIEVMRPEVGDRTHFRRFAILFAS